MKIETFCRKTAWPLQEFMSLPVPVAFQVLSLYGLTLRIRLPRGAR